MKNKIQDIFIILGIITIIILGVSCTAERQLRRLPMHMPIKQAVPVRVPADNINIRHI